jgi:hypothetical protein
MFAVVRSLRRLHGFKPRRAGGRPRRRRRTADRIKRVGTPLRALGGIAGIAGIAGRLDPGRWRHLVGLAIDDPLRCR